MNEELSSQSKNRGLRIRMSTTPQKWIPAAWKKAEDALTEEEKKSWENYISEEPLPPDLDECGL